MWWKKGTKLVFADFDGKIFTIDLEDNNAGISGFR